MLSSKSECKDKRFVLIMQVLTQEKNRILSRLALSLSYLCNFESKKLLSLIAVVLGLEGTIHGHSYIIGLLLRKSGQFHANLLQVQTGDLFV